MASWPARTWVSGETVTSTLGNVEWRDNLNDLNTRVTAIDARTSALEAGSGNHGVLVTNSVNPTVATSTTTAVPWNTDAWDTDSMHGGSSSDIAVASAGTYGFIVWIQWDATSGAGNRGASVRNVSNGNGILSSLAAPGSTAINVAHTLSGSVVLTTGNILRVEAFQDSGGTLSIVNGSFTVWKIA